MTGTIIDQALSGKKIDREAAKRRCYELLHKGGDDPQDAAERSGLIDQLKLGDDVVRRDFKDVQLARSWREVISRGSGIRDELDAAREACEACKAEIRQVQADMTEKKLKPLNEALIELENRKTAADGSR